MIFSLIIVICILYFLGAVLTLGLVGMINESTTKFDIPMKHEFLIAGLWFLYAVVIVALFLYAICSPDEF